MYLEIEWRGYAWDKKCKIGIFRLLKHVPHAEVPRPSWTWACLIEECRDEQGRLGIEFHGVKEFFPDRKERMEFMGEVKWFMLREGYSFGRWFRTSPVHRTFIYDLDLRRERCSDLYLSSLVGR